MELDVVRCRVPFDTLDLSTVDAFARWVSEQVDATSGALELDLSDVEFVMAAGIQALLDLDGVLRSQGRTLVVTGPAPIVARVLHICGVADRWLAT